MHTFCTKGEKYSSHVSLKYGTLNGEASKKDLLGNCKNQRSPIACD